MTRRAGSARVVSGLSPRPDVRATAIRRAQGAADRQRQGCATAFKEFSERVQAYLKLQQTVEAESSRAEAHGPARR